MRNRIALLFVLLLPFAHTHAQYANTANCLTPDEADLADRVNDYRQANGLTRVPVSFSLSSVGQWHVWDLETNDPWQGNCNLHSWSNARPALWNSVCYLSDHSAAAGMWDKPEEIASYTSAGYENAAWTSGTITPAGALVMWQNSPGHNAVIRNLGDWSGLTWRAMGVGMSQHYAVLWFGTLTDPQGVMQPCGATSPGMVFADHFEG